MDKEILILVVVIFGMVILFESILAVICYRANNKNEGIITPKVNIYDILLQDSKWKYLSNKLKEKYGKCQICGCKKNLQVHHKYYLKYSDTMMNPWDYPEDAFIVVCDKCHKKLHEQHVNVIQLKK